jgi:hypothetical protein
MRQRGSGATAALAVAYGAVLAAALATARVVPTAAHQ